MRSPLPVRDAWNQSQFGFDQSFEPPNAPMPLKLPKPRPASESSDMPSDWKPDIICRRLTWSLVERSIATRRLVPGVAAIGVAAAVGLRWVLDPTPIPTYTWPFLLAMWAVLIADELLSPQRRQFSDASPSSERAPA